MPSDRDISTIVDYEEAIDSCPFNQFTLRNVKLAQQPSETLDLILAFHYDVERDDVFGIHHEGSEKSYCTLALRFQNAIGEYGREYDYEISCVAYTRDLNQHLHIFTHTYKNRVPMRAFDVERINIRTPIFPITRLSFTICRFKKTSKDATVSSSQDTKDNKTDDSTDKCSNKCSIDVGSMLLESGVYSDVVLQVGEREFKAHKHILSASSPVFRAMFNHGMSEQTTGVVDIVDVAPDAVAEMLLYIYTGRTKNIGRIPLQLFKAAHKYELAGLLDLCEDYLVFGICCANVIGILELVKVYELPWLHSLALTFLGKHEKELANEPSYREYLKSELCDASLVNTLKLCAIYNIEDVKQVAFDFIKRNSVLVAENEQFLDLFKTHTDLMKEIYISMSKDYQYSEKYNS